MAYQSIGVDDRRDSFDDREAGVRRHNSNNTNDFLRIPKFSTSCLAVLLAIVVFIAFDWARLRLLSSSGDIDTASSSVALRGGETLTTDNSLVGISSSGTQTSDTKNNIPLPTGVNLGSWLSLEDWLFVGANGAIEVASPDDAVAAACLPPLHLDESTGPRWNSETDLLAGLAEHYQKEMEKSEEGGGGSMSTLGGNPNDRANSLGGWGKAVKTINAFRMSYFDLDTELRTIQDLGIKYVRVPVSWCWTDNDPSELVRKNETADNGESWIYMKDEEVKEKFTCKDPFYDDVRWPAVPRNLVQKFLRACAKHGIGATLDIHTYPGGTSIGTFSGVWPRYSRFWTHGDVPAIDNNQQPDIGRTILKDVIHWLESLADSDPSAFEGFRALSPMNEPAHLAGLYNGKKPVRTDRETFLPPLPPDMANKYLSELNSQTNTLTQVPDGNHLRMLLWLHDAIDAFRKSKLPLLGKELHVNVHESVFPADVLPQSKTRPDYGLNTGSMHIFGAWWRASTTAAERSKWAVLDIHHYHAWGPECSGAVEGPPTGRFACSDEERKAEVMKKCVTWSHVYRSTLEQECEEGLRLASAEFSASTHHSVRHACNDVSTLQMMLVSQVNAARNANVELFWWSYKMPYGGAFRNAWSLKHLLYLLGILPQPDEELFHCGDHSPPHGEPKDGSM